MLLMEVVLNGKKAFLLIDTGASKSLLDINKSSKYNFSYNKLNIEKYIGIGGIQDMYTIYNYKIDNFFIPMIGTDLSEIAPFFNYDGIYIVGIIGSDFLNNRNAIIDYKNNKLLLIK
jgi:hypothetical protein